MVEMTSKRTDDYACQAAKDTVGELRSDAESGLGSREVARRLSVVGYNGIDEREEPLWHRVFRRFWGPIPWMIEPRADADARTREVPRE